MRGIITLVTAALLLAGLWVEVVHLRAWSAREAADQAYHDGEFDRALAGYQRARDLLPDDPRSHTDLAGTISEALDGEPGRKMETAEIEELAGQAARSYLEAIRSGPPNAWSYAGLGALAGTLKEARQRGMERDISLLSPEALAQMPPEDRLGEAALVKSVQLEPRNYYYRDFLGYFYMRRGFTGRATAHFRTAARLQPVLGRHFYLSQLATVSPGVLDAVESGIQEALRSSETEVSPYDIHRFLADIYLRMNRLEDARESLEAAAEVAPFPHVVDVRIGQILARKGDDAGALEAFRRATERGPDYERAWRQLALTHSRLGHHTEAIAAAERGRALDPTGLSTLRALARVLESGGRPDEAAEVLETLLLIHVDRQQPYLDLIRIYESRAKTSHALRIARRLAALHPDEPAYARQVEQLERAMVESP